ncbi:hypothetical protein PIB30_091122 [Stylosanthes scabra]|uniref:Uncharacterized protein n=1 Tax=Stylosanthes scabra TaxID=79078 RepID=A0ABU6SUY3_9FABA|nr:hypothetical protein [Stylosanthes scabra]
MSSHPFLPVSLFISVRFNLSLVTQLGLVALTSCVSAFISTLITASSNGLHISQHFFAVATSSPPLHTTVCFLVIAEGEIQKSDVFSNHRALLVLPMSCIWSESTSASTNISSILTSHVSCLRCSSLCSLPPLCSPSRLKFRRVSLGQCRRGYATSVDVICSAETLLLLR